MPLVTVAFKRSSLSKISVGFLLEKGLASPDLPSSGYALPGTRCPTERVALAEFVGGCRVSPADTDARGQGTDTSDGSGL